MNDPLNTTWQTVSANVVYATIANASLGADESNPANVGGITLHHHQQDAVARISVAIREFGGALLADTVGLGKTYVALAVSTQFKHVHVLAPANLLPMWRSAIAATHRVHVSLHSLHALSRRALANNNPQRETLVIVDEAHHLRTQNTARYRNAAQFMVGRSALLLSATPLHNSSKEFRNILALFLGHRADSLDEAILAGCIVRRTSAQVTSASLPAVHEHPSHAITDNPPILESILTLPAPLPPQDGAAASALVRLGLLRAWCSSDAALTDTIRRRQMRGEALLHSLAHGRYPTQRELQTWIVGNDAIQLGFPELLVATASGDCGEMLATLTKHLDALSLLLQVHTRSALADPQRASMLRALLREDTPIIAFSQFASTVRSLHRALSDVAGVASLTSQGGRVAGGPIARQELIAKFAPRAHSRPPPAEHERVRLLLTTDMLSEGVNLQDAGILVHLDLPWTDAARAQRVGRLARLGSQHETIHVHTIAPPSGAERVLRLVETLKRKARLSDTIVGAIPSSAAMLHGRNESAAECATRLRAIMLKWQQETSDEHLPRVSCGVVIVACTNATQAGWLAVVNCNDRTIVLAQLQSEGSAASAKSDASTTSTASIVSSASTVSIASTASTASTVSTASAAASATGAASSSVIDIMHTIDCIVDGKTNETQRQTTAELAQTRTIDSAIGDINRWHQNNRVNDLAGRTERSLSQSHKRALKLLAQRISANPATTRNSFAANADRIAQSISRIVGAGVESQLDEWSRQSSTLKLRDWLNAFFKTVQSASVGTEPHESHVAHAAKLRIRALLVLQPSPRCHTLDHQS